MPVTAVKSVWSGGNLHFENAAGDNVAAIRSDGNVVALTGATNTVTAAQNGCTFLVGTADMVITLPSTAAGLKYTFVLQNAALSASTGMQISPAALDAIHGNALTSVDDKDLINSGATDAEGDAVTLVADGVDGWYVQSVVGTWAKEA